LGIWKNCKVVFSLFDIDDKEIIFKKNKQEENILQFNVILVVDRQLCGSGKGIINLTHSTQHQAAEQRFSTMWNLLLFIFLIVVFVSVFLKGVNLVLDGLNSDGLVPHSDLHINLHFRGKDTTGG